MTRYTNTPEQNEMAQELLRGAREEIAAGRLKIRGVKIKAVTKATSRDGAAISGRWSFFRCTMGRGLSSPPATSGKTKPPRMPRTRSSRACSGSPRPRKETSHVP